MTWIFDLSSTDDETSPSLVGGKAGALIEISHLGCDVPKGLCVTTTAYADFLHSTGIDGRIAIELSRKPFADMRWEEIWDVSLRIRNLFLKTPMPDGLYQELYLAVTGAFGLHPVAVRSSAPGEDSARASFAGLHETFLNVRGTLNILDHVKLVWASLWSDRALLYRKELGLDIDKSTMAVLVQELIPGDSSGVCFTRSPDDPSRMAIEAVYGLNQGLVDGAVEPDRWLLDRETGQIVSHRSPETRTAVITSRKGTRLSRLSKSKSTAPPLDVKEVGDICRLGWKIESHFGAPSDIEWTLREGNLVLLQARPITAGKPRDEEADKRPWYLSLTRSLENLKSLRMKIEKEIIPGIDEAAGCLKACKLSVLHDNELADEIEKRQKTFENWEARYYEDLVPFAHGMRLFGQIYNDTVQPEDPFEFLALLRGTGLESIRRNNLLEKAALDLRPFAGALREYSEGKTPQIPPSAAQAIQHVASALQESTNLLLETDDVVRVVVQYLQAPSPRVKGARDTEDALEGFLGMFSGREQGAMQDLLDLARASTRLRDDDNIHLGKIERQVALAVKEGIRRIKGDRPDLAGLSATRDVTLLLRDRNALPADPLKREARHREKPFARIRQVTGQPASSGVATGQAIVIVEEQDLFSVKAGNILVCDAIDPNMTFAVPLCSGIVERRGGMLIHGAIIAREYGIPCVTGVKGATEIIETEDTVTVDGSLGYVFISKPASLAKERPENATRSA
ncbi:MAG: PEP/pyruvate-binding domain-containing protein [Thermovirgaceae bacterium]